jgi:hypothetical protein
VQPVQSVHSGLQCQLLCEGKLPSLFQTVSTKSTLISLLYKTKWYLLRCQRYCEQCKKMCWNICVALVSRFCFLSIKLRTLFFSPVRQIKYTALCSFQRVSILLLPIMQQHILLMGQLGGTSQSMSSRSGVELWCMWPTEIPPWSGLCELSSGRQSHWLWGVWRRLPYHHAVVPALSSAWHTSVHATQRQAHQGIAHVLNNCYIQHVCLFLLQHSVLTLWQFLTKFTEIEALKIVESSILYHVNGTA